MLLGQIKYEGSVVAAIFQDASATSARPIPEYTLLDLIRRAVFQNVSLPSVAERLAAHLVEEIQPEIPLAPPEIWACGCTYETSASFRDAEHGTREGMYAYVYREPRPEIFFKGTARVCVGPNQPIGLRADSKFTAPEPEMGIVLGGKGQILGLLLANDVSAWDIERENALYLPQSKVYDACCALGPVMATLDSIANPYALDMSCSILRGGKEIYSGQTSTAKLHRKFETLVEYLERSNSLPIGTVVLTGTGIIVTEESALAAGDVVTIAVPELGNLTNPCQVV